MRPKSTAKETTELRNNILQYLIEYKSCNGGDSPSLRDIAQHFDLAKSTAKYHLDALCRDDKIRVSVLGNHKTSIAVVFPPEIDGVIDLGYANLFNFGFGRVWLGKKKTIIAEVNHKYLKSLDEMKAFIDEMIKVHDRILTEE